METKINWADFPIFLAVVESGSLSGAARSLHLSQPTVGRRMSALEQNIGAPLLQKTSSGLAPTEMGVRVLDHVRHMDREAEAIGRSSAARDQVLAGEVTVSATQGIGDHWLPDALFDFNQQYPEIRLVVDVSSQMANLARREADIALRWMGPGNQNSLIGRKVITTGFGLYASEVYLEKNGIPKTFADLANHTGVSIQLGDNSLVWPGKLDDIAISPKNVAFRSNSFNAHQTAIAAGYGIGSLAHVQASWSDELVQVLPDFETMQDLWIVAHDDLARNKRIRLVFDYLIERLREDQTHFLSGKK
ncbi:MAG: hypothetical protein COA47_09800 [Robiginitomaculum sp.]|nr:MAG: hypothetical protein COA47_09800 [Robiginitomaculum sp.]